MDDATREAFADRVCDLVREWIMDHDAESLRVEVADGRRADLPQEVPEYLRQNIRQARSIRLKVNGGYLPATTEVLTPEDGE